MASILSHNAYDASIGVADGVQYVEGINSKEGNAGSDRDLRWPNPEHGWYFGNIKTISHGLNTLA
jgi:hypothetical protein